MTSKHIKNIIKETLIKLDAPDVTVGRIKGMRKLEDGIEINELYLSMGECTGSEFEAIVEMRQQIEMEHNINVVNVKIDL